MEEAYLYKKAKLRAMHLLERMDRTEAQLREKLRQSDYSQDVIEEAIAYVKQYHYIDDFRYACAYIRCRGGDKGRHRLAMELYQRGVDRDLVEQALEEEYREDGDREKILHLIEKRRYDAAFADAREQRRMYQFLLRKGFRSEEIRKWI